MVSQLELVKQFCSTYDIKYFFKLNKETQKFFTEAAYYLLGLYANIDKPLYAGIASIIINATKPIIYKPFGKLYSLTDVEVIESKKYDMKLLFLGDSHTYNHGCPKKSDDYNLIKKVTSKINLPVIAAGGCGDKGDCVKAINYGANAVAAGSIFFWVGESVISVKKYMAHKNLNVRLI